MKTLPFYIVTSDVTSHILPAICYLYNKYWNVDGSQRFTILGNTKPKEALPGNFDFVKIKDENNIRHWTKHIYRFIRDNLVSDYFVLTLDDYLPNTHLKANIFDGLLAYAQQSGRVGRIGLGWSPVEGFEIFKKCEGYAMYRLNQNAPYRLVCQTSVWHRKYLLKYFNHNWKPWQLELRGSWWAKNDGWEIIGSKNSIPFDWVEESALSGRWPGKINILGLQKEDLKYFIEQGILKKENLQYGMWLDKKPPLFSEFGYGLRLEMIKDYVDDSMYNGLYSHYRSVYK